MIAAERRFQGQSAGEGLAAGPLVSPPPVAHPGRAIAAANPETRLHDALACAREELAAIAAREGEDASAILELQIEMLRDPALLADVLPGIAAGEDPADAWWRSLNARVRRFEQAPAPGFRARAADIADLRDRVHRILRGGEEPAPVLPPNAILLVDDLTPSGFLSLDWRRLGGAALRGGTPSGHLAVLARGRGIPVVTGLGGEPRAGGDAILDADAGILVVAPSAETRAGLSRREARRRRVHQAASREMAGAARTRDGTRVSVRLNIDDPGVVPEAVLRASEGVGLVRTESLFLTADHLPDAGEYESAYRALLARLGPKPCVFRTLDLGGDKPLGALAEALDAPPAGSRGLRLCLAEPALFRPQVRALLRVAVDPRVRVMFPMVATVGEFEAARALFESELAVLEGAGESVAMPPLGIMIETPAAAVTVDLFDADFYAVGSNDLTCAVLGHGRGGAATTSPVPEPAVLRLIEAVVRFGRSVGREVSLCGELAAEPAALESLLATGLRHVSVAPASFARVKQHIRRLELSPAEVE